MNRRIFTVICTLFGTVFCILPAAGLEFQPSLREAERLYQSGRYQEAAHKAGEINRFFPDDLQTLLILGMSEFNSNNYLQASRWFKQAHKKSPRHPLVVRYTGLLQEIEHRRGQPFSSDPEVIARTDNTATAVYFKRQFFGPSFTQTSGETSVPPAATAPTALAMVYPPDKDGSSEYTVWLMADEALKSGNFEKAFLFFSQLNAENPDNRKFLLGKAESAFHMKRYREVISGLGPSLALPEPAGFTQEERFKAESLLKHARSEVFSSR